MVCRAWRTTRGGGVPELPAQRLGFGVGERAANAQQLEPAHEICGEAHQRHPGPVGVEVGEREPARDRRL